MANCYEGITHAFLLGGSLLRGEMWCAGRLWLCLDHAFMFRSSLSTHHHWDPSGNWTFPRPDVMSVPTKGKAVEFLLSDYFPSPHLCFLMMVMKTLKY